MLFGRTDAGLFIGAGVGFIAMGLTRIFGVLVSMAFEKEEEEKEK